MLRVATERSLDRSSAGRPGAEELRPKTWLGGAGEAECPGALGPASAAPRRRYGRPWTHKPGADSDTKALATLRGELAGDSEGTRRGLVMVGARDSARMGLLGDSPSSEAAAPVEVDLARNR